MIFGRERTSNGAACNGRGSRIAGGVACSRRAHVATGLSARLRGSIGRALLDNGAGLLITPRWGIHTIGVRFPIDAVFLRVDGCVLRAVSSVRPNRLGLIAWGAASVLDRPVGTIERTGTHAGDSLDLAFGDALGEI
jgi:uncharacterized membrane protein (UPF0127 family)